MNTNTVLLMVFLAYSAEGDVNLKNNVCNSFVGYFFKYIDKGCYYSDELFLQTPQILSQRNIPYENHTVVTEDGYILTAFRVTKNNPKGVIVMLNPIIEDSTIWFVGDNRSYVNIFANAGYELWLLNCRGVTYSDKHIRNLTDAEYWNFSFHENGVYDYSAVFRYINNITKTKVIAFSMSIGSTASAVYASEKPEEAKELVKVFVAMAVPAFMKKTTSLIRIIVPFRSIIKTVLNAFGFHALFYTRFKWIIDIVSNILMALNAEWLCAIIATPFVGGSPWRIDASYLPMGLSITPEPTSVKTVLHLAQLLTNDDEFTLYDYGKKKNLQLYNSEKPPQYPIGDISVPFYVIYGESDNLASKEGNIKFYHKLPEAAKIYGYLNISGCSHADFLIGKRPPKIAQDHTLSLLAKI